MQDTYDDYCPKCKRNATFRRYDGPTVGLRCDNCRKMWAAPMLDEAQDHDPNYEP